MALSPKQDTRETGAGCAKRIRLANALSALGGSATHYGDYGRIFVYQPKTWVDNTKEVETLPFSFDYFFGEKANNCKIYDETIRNLIPGAFEGCWASVFVYDSMKDIPSIKEETLKGRLQVPEINQRKKDVPKKEENTWRALFVSAVDENSTFETRSRKGDKCSYWWKRCCRRYHGCSMREYLSPK